MRQLLLNDLATGRLLSFDMADQLSRITVRMRRLVQAAPELFVDVYDMEKKRWVLAHVVPKDWP